ncbi:MAG: 6-pyruvoyl tetrahydropterin synthase family protein, partial [Lachnospiraceae bacterium]|nr:6-pyruvoyl tetrahydropterin synthase family protein [Lachnospiraceae bacterium]
MFSVTTEASFDSAHFLKGYDGKCANLHGHRWRICVSAKAENVGDDGMVIDFTDLKRDLKNLADNLDHSLIVEEGSLKEKTVEALREENFRMVFLPFRPTAENFA